VPSKAFLGDQAEVFVPIPPTHERAEMLKLALPAGKYALIAQGQVDCGKHATIDSFIETSTTIVARAGVELPGLPVFSLPVPAFFGVLSLAAADTVRVTCALRNVSPPEDSQGRVFRLMVWSVDTIG